MPICQIFCHTGRFSSGITHNSSKNRNQFRGLQEPTVFTIRTLFIVVHMYKKKYKNIIFFLQIFIIKMITIWLFTIIIRLELIHVIKQSLTHGYLSIYSFIIPCQCLKKNHNTNGSNRNGYEFNFTRMIFRSDNGIVYNSKDIIIPECKIIVHESNLEIIEIRANKCEINRWMFKIWA